MKFPIYFLRGDGSVIEFAAPTDFVYVAGDNEKYQYPASAFDLWTDAEWAACCPTWRKLALALNEPRPDPTKNVSLAPRSEWVVDPVALTYTRTYKVTAKSANQIEAEIGGARVAKVRAIDAERDRRLALGALHAGKRFSTSDASRTDLGGMATTAGLVLSGALPAWPDSYAQGWIAIDNTRLPLPTPADGIALAAAVALSYSATVQHARDLKDAALTATNPAAVDELAGWPE